MGSVWGQGTLISGVRSLVLCLVPGAVVTTMPSSMGGGGKSRPLSDLYNLQFRNVFTFLNGWGRKTNQRQNNSS